MPKEPSNAELLEFIKENVATKGDLAPHANQLANITSKLVTIEETMATKTDLGHVEGRLDNLQTSVDNLAKKVDAFQSEKHFTDKRISRVEFRTGKLLGPKVQAVDVQFEEQYHAG